MAPRATKPTGLLSGKPLEVAASAAAPEPPAPRNDPRDTPAMRQHARFKERHPGCLLLFRMGDFYELFDDDAVTAHKALGITLTERTAGVPMAGVPHHSVDSYIRRLIEQGFRVAVCEQIQDPREAKGVVERAVTRVITPGTLVDESLLSEDTETRLAAACPGPGGAITLALVDLSTGAFTIHSCAAPALAEALAQRRVGELLAPASPHGEMDEALQRAAAAAGVPLTARASWEFRAAEARQSLLEQFGVTTLDAFGIEGDDGAVGAAGAAVRYLRETQHTAASDSPRTGRGARPLAHLSPPRREAAGGTLVIDAAARRALEIERTIRGDKTDGSVVGVFLSGARCTAMGRRVVRQWLCEPLAQRAAIEARLACVALLVEDGATRDALAESVEGVQDVARIAGRFGVGRATPRDLVAAGRSLARLDALARAMEGAPAFAAHAARLGAVRDALAPLAQEILDRCVDDPPAHLRDGGLFRDGVDAELDECRSLQRDARQWLARHQADLAARHDLPNIKVGYNRVFGYYIELPAAQARRAPAEFSRRQTLKNAERYTTPELRDFEEKVTTAQSRAVEREQSLFDGLAARVAERLPALIEFGAVVGEADALLRFASVAQKRAWARPEIVDGPALDLRDARHPALEAPLGESLVPNDILLGVEGAPARLALITGPNMAGKSTYIRTAALVTLLAHAGSFVPARSARVGLTDRIFTRVGAEDALHAGQSTFMVEMTETARVLHEATDRSLVILDEVGRGTSTLDGLALAWAIAERLADGPVRPRTLFATHYHELTQLEDSAPERVRNLHVSVREWGDEIVFLHRILAGRTDRSYGIHVAKLAGLPEGVVARAREMLDTLTVSHEGGAPPPSGRRAPRRQAPSQPGLFHAPAPGAAVRDALLALQLESLTPLAAFDALRRLRDLADSDG